MSNWLDRIVTTAVRSKAVERKASVPDGLWSKCGACEAVLYQPELERNQSVCPKCGHHGRLGARARLNGFLDEGSSTELFKELVAEDRLKFKDQKKYKDRLAQAQNRRVKATLWSPWKGLFNQNRLLQLLSSLRLWVVRWVRSSVRNLCVPQSYAWRSGCHWFVSLHRVERGCRRRCYLSCRWPEHLRYSKNA